MINGFAAIIEFVFAQIFFKLFLNIIEFCLLNRKVQAYGLLHFLKRVKMSPFNIVFRARQPLKVVGIDKVLIILLRLKTILSSNSFAGIDHIRSDSEVAVPIFNFVNYFVGMRLKDFFNMTFRNSFSSYDWLRTFFCHFFLHFWWRTIF